jgi:hypothetical protein
MQGKAEHSLGGRARGINARSCFDLSAPSGWRCFGLVAVSLSLFAVAVFPRLDLRASVFRATSSLKAERLDARRVEAFEKPRLITQADAALSAEVKTITAVPNPSSAGGLHDFSSQGDYWWPDPEDANRPYVLRDGLTNPDNFVAHRQLLLAFCRNFDALAAAYKLIRSERYAAAAVRHLHAWFVDPGTRMNPNLLYAQAITGRDTGRSIGVIDTLHLAEVALGVEALRGSVSFPKEEEVAVTAWFREYLDWMLTHPFGVEESKQPNNHGTCGWLQIAAFAHLTGDQDVLARARLQLSSVLLPTQMDADGSFPRELARTKAFAYSLFNLDVMAALGVITSTPQQDMLTFTLHDGRSLIKGVEFMAPFIADKGAWLRTVYKPGGKGRGGFDARRTSDIVKPDAMHWQEWPVRQPALLFGALSAGRTDWFELWQTLEADPQTEEIRRNFPIRQPVLWLK